MRRIAGNVIPALSGVHRRTKAGRCYAHIVRCLDRYEVYHRAPASQISRGRGRLVVQDVFELGTGVGRHVGFRPALQLIAECRIRAIFFHVTNCLNTAEWIGLGRWLIKLSARQRSLFPVGFWLDKAIRLLPLTVCFGVMMVMPPHPVPPLLGINRILLPGESGCPLSSVELHEELSSSFLRRTMLGRERRRPPALSGWAMFLNDVARFAWLSDIWLVLFCVAWRSALWNECERNGRFDLMEELVTLCKRNKKLINK